MENPSRNLDNLYKKLKADIEADRMYWIRNDAKLKAVGTSKSYEEFRERVDAAHLTSLSREDCQKKARTGWNKALQ